MGFFQTLLSTGGVGTALIILSGICLFVIGSERVVTLFFRLSFNTDSSVNTVRTHILARRYTDALQVCNAAADAPDLSVIKSALLAVENGREAMKSALGAALLETSQKCESRLQYISLIANVATLLGLLGTITGLIKTFNAIANADAAEKAKLLGLGISEAMYSTAAGLGVGITAMVVHTICISKSDAIVGHAQDLGYKLMTWVEQSERKQG
jgi:biopolymer transport protein ExbB/TolQ